MTGRSVPLLLLAVLSAACSRGGGAAETIPRERFVAANVALRAVPDTAPQADSLRAAALKEAAVTAPQLRAWVRGHRHDPALLAEVWREITDSLQRRDSVSLAGAAAGKPEPPASTVDTLRPYALPEPEAAPPPAPVRMEPPRTTTKRLEVRGQMPIEPDSGDASRR